MSWRDPKKSDFELPETQKETGFRGLLFGKTQIYSYVYFILIYVLVTFIVFLIFTYSKIFSLNNDLNILKKETTLQKSEIFKLNENLNKITKSYKEFSDLLTKRIKILKKKNSSRN